MQLLDLTGDRSANVTVYTRLDNIFNIPTTEGGEINFDTLEWSVIEVDTSEEKLSRRISVLPARRARYVAIVRNGFLNLAEVEIYQYPGDYDRK
mgnify:CR=1 FL=1